MITFRQVHKSYGHVEVLNNICLSVPKGTMCVICGTSGAGKSTLLGTVNGLEPIQRGEIWVNGRRLGDPSIKLRQLRTQIGVVYQSYNLFPHLTVERNILLGLEKGLGLDRGESVRRAHCELDRLGLLAWRNALPAHLSGGQQQRVAIARCLMSRHRRSTSTTPRRSSIRSARSRRAESRFFSRLTRFRCSPILRTTWFASKEDASSSRGGARTSSRMAANRNSFR
jgi:ABC-type sugar transport system ATPase subunit